MKDGPEYRARLESAKASSLGHRLVKAARLFNEVALAEFRRDPRFGFARPSHLTVMPHLDLDGTRLSELARRMEVTKQAAGQLVDELERRGLVERRPDPQDGRAKRVLFTDLGREAMIVGLGALARVDERLADVVDAGTLAALDETLGQLTDALESTLAAESPAGVEGR